MNRYIISPSASHDLDEIIDYFVNTNVAAGERFLVKFTKRCQQLTNFPMMGRSYDKIRSGLRGLPLEKYIILYRVNSDSLEVVRVVHGSRNLKALLNPDKEDT